MGFTDFRTKRGFGALKGFAENVEHLKLLDLMKKTVALASQEHLINNNRIDQH